MKVNQGEKHKKVSLPISFPAQRLLSPPQTKQLKVMFLVLCVQGVVLYSNLLYIMNNYFWTDSIFYVFNPPSLQKIAIFPVISSSPTPRNSSSLIYTRYGRRPVNSSTLQLFNLVQSTFSLLP